MAAGTVLVTQSSRSRRLPLRCCSRGLAAGLGLTVALAIWSGGASAQSNSTVTAGSVVQDQSGAMNQQQMRIGDAVGSASSNVKVDSVVQTQSGVMNRQQLEIGDADDNGSTRVDLGSIVQQQPGLMHEQKAASGVSPERAQNAQAGPSAQRRAFSSAASDAGNEDGGKTPLDVSGILHAQRRMADTSPPGMGNPARITNR
jgi:hypothetical protein